MKLITEQIEDVQILTEERDGKKLLYIEGVFLQSELTNRNGRRYPFEVLNREVERYNEEYVKTCLLYTSPSPRDATLSRMPSSA